MTLNKSRCIAKHENWKKIETQSNWKSEYAKQMGEHWKVLYWPHFFNFTREQQKYIKQNV